jgi:hypothetical protein
MLPELSIERVFRREIDSLPLPAEGLWIPDRPTARRSIPLTVLVITATVLLVLGAVVTARDVGDAAATVRRGERTVPLPILPRPTCLRGDCNVYRNDAFGYGIVLPAGWWQATALIQGRPPRAGELHRVEFTGRTPDEWISAVGPGLVVPWDVVVDVHERRGVLAMDWARADGCGANPCVTSQTTIGGSPAYAASWSLSPSLQMHAYYVERGDRILILRYVTGPGSEGPHGVTERTLEQIVGSIALN